MSVVPPPLLGLIGQQVRAEAGQPVGDVRRRALADADEGDDRGDADDDAEHRQRGPQPARPQARQREPEQLEEAHADDPPVAQVDLAGRPAAATSASWVMSTIVRPAALSSWSRAMTSAPAWLSRLPVGSSARMSAGSVTSARATATRCCWPPDSSVGSWSSRSPSPSRSSAAVARRRALAARDALVEQRRRDVVERRRPRQQVVRLEDEPDRPAAEPREAVVVELGDRRAGQAVAAGGRPVEAAQDVHHRALARAGRPDDRDELAGSDLEADVDQRRHLHVAHVVDAADVVERDDRLGSSVSSRSRGRVPPPPPTGNPPPSPPPKPLPVVGVPVWAVLTPVTTAGPRSGRS